MVLHEVVERRPRAVDRLAELQLLRREREPAAVVFAALPLRHALVVRHAPAVVLVEVRERQVVDVRLVRAHALHVLGHPLARMELRARQDRHTDTPQIYRRVAGTVQQHRRAVRKDEELRLAHSRVDEMDLELALLPGRDALLRVRIFGRNKLRPSRCGKSQRPAYKTSSANLHTPCNVLNGFRGCLDDQARQIHVVATASHVARRSLSSRTRRATEAGSETPATAAQTAILAIIFMSALLPLGVHRSRGAQNHFLAIIRAVIISHFTLFPQAEAFVRKAQSAVERRPYRGRETQIVTGFKGNAPCRTAGR